MPFPRPFHRPTHSHSASPCARPSWRVTPWIAVVGAAVLLTPGIALPQTNAAFAGKVQDQSGKALPGVSVKYTRVPARVSVTLNGHKTVQVAPNEPAASGAVTSAADGSFGFSGLPPGNYYICPSPPSPAFENTCLWRGWTSVTLQAGGQAPVPTIAIRPGVQVHYQISDPSHLIPLTTDFSSLMVIGVRAANGAFRPATMTSRTSSGAQFDITVPTDMPVYLWAFSREFKFLGQNGKSVAPTPTATSKAGLIPIVIPPGATNYTIPLTLTH
jgi:hypothetical protein